MSEYIWDKYEPATEKTTGFVLFPRNYVLNHTDEKMAYVKGVDQTGKLCVVFLRLENRFIESAKKDLSYSIPSFAKLAETGRNAKNPCYAHKANSNDNQHGVLLIEQAMLLKHDQMERFNLYYCKWMSVLRASNDTYDPAPEIGIGYLEINMSNKLSDDAAEMLVEHKNISKAIEQSKSNGEPVVDLLEQRKRVAFDIIASRNKWYKAITMFTQQTKTIEPARSALFNEFDNAVQHYSANGEYGSLIVRARINGTVITKLCGVIHHGYDGRKKAPFTANESFNTYMKFGGAKSLAEAAQMGCTLEIIPAKQTNFNISGSKMSDSINKSLQQGATPKLFATYLEPELHEKPDMELNKEKGYLCSKIAVRKSLLKNQYQGNLLGSSINSFSAPICNVFEIGPDGNRAYLMDYKIKEENKMAS